MTDMTMGQRIGAERKKLGLSQEGLGEKLGISRQAIYKWESDQCYPDIQLLPALAELFGITLDSLFGREQPAAHQELPQKGPFGICFGDLFEEAQAAVPGEKPWEDDDTLHIVLYQGHRLLKHCPAADKLTFEYSGPALNIDCAVSVCCGDVAGSVDAGGSVSCGNVGGDVDAGSGVNCGDVEGSVDAGSGVSCGNIGGDVDAGSHVTCGSVGGSVDAGGTVYIGK